jgi:MFS family permease
MPILTAQCGRSEKGKASCQPRNLPLMPVGPRRRSGRFWPWLADKFGRRTLLAINIAMFSLSMPMVALSSSFWIFVGLYALVRFSLNGEWAIGSMLVAETWPARMRGFVVSADRSTWGVGAALAGGISAYIVETYGWRAAFIPPGIIALIAIYVRLKCPESPYWVRTQDRKNRLRVRLEHGQGLSLEDQNQARQGADQAAFHAGPDQKHAAVDLRRFHRGDRVQHGRAVDAAVPEGAARFQRSGIWQFLYLVGPRGGDRDLFRRLVHRQVGTPPRLRFHAAGSNGFHDLVDIRHG